MNFESFSKFENQFLISKFFVGRIGTAHSFLSLSLHQSISFPPYPRPSPTFGSLHPPRQPASPGPIVNCSPRLAHLAEPPLSLPVHHPNSSASLSMSVVCMTPEDIKAPGILALRVPRPPLYVALATIVGNPAVCRCLSRLFHARRCPSRTRSPPTELLKPSPFATGSALTPYAMCCHRLKLPILLTPAPSLSSPHPAVPVTTETLPPHSSYCR